MEGFPGAGGLSGAGAAPAGQSASPAAQAGVLLDDRQRAVRVEAGQQLVDRRFAELGLERELLARDPLARKMVLDRGRNPFLVVVH